MDGWGIECIYGGECFFASCTTDKGARCCKACWHFEKCSAPCYIAKPRTNERQMVSSRCDDEEVDDEQQQY